VLGALDSLVAFFSDSTSDYLAILIIGSLMATVCAITCIISNAFWSDAEGDSVSEDVVSSVSFDGLTCVRCGNSAVRVRNSEWFQCVHCKHRYKGEPIAKKSRMVR
jgi:hypothetical protein